MATNLAIAPIVRRNLAKWWQDEIEKLIWLGLSGQHSDTDLCAANNVTPELYYTWREMYVRGGRDSLVGRASDREVELRARVESLEKQLHELKSTIDEGNEK